MSTFVRSLLKNRFLVAAVLAAAANFASETCSENSNVSSTLSISPVQGRMLKKLPGWLTCRPQVEETRRDETIAQERTDLTECLKHHITDTTYLKKEVARMCSGKHKVAKWQAFIHERGWSGFDRMTKADYKAVKQEIDAHLTLGSSERTTAVAGRCPDRQAQSEIVPIVPLELDDVDIPTRPVEPFIVQKPKVDPFAEYIVEIERLLEQEDYQSVEEKCANLERRELSGGNLRKVQDFKQEASVLRAADEDRKERERKADEARKEREERERKEREEREERERKEREERERRRTVEIQQDALKQNLLLRRSGEVEGLVRTLIDSKVRQKRPYFAKLKTDATTRKLFVKSTTKIIREMGNGIWSYTGGLDEQMTKIEKAAHDEYLKDSLNLEVEKAIKEHLARE